MNPFKITLLTLVASTILTVIAGVSTHWDGLSVLFGWFYFTPAICMVAFIVSSLFYPSWVKNNKKDFTILWAALVFWLLAVTAIFIAGK